MDIFHSFDTQEIIILATSVALVAIIAFFVARHIMRKLRETETLKYEFISIIAHKFRTPLTHVKWLIDAMAADEQDSYKKENMTEIQKSNQHLIDLTGTLVELTDTGRSSKVLYNNERLSICELTRTVAESMKNSFHEKNIFFSVQCAVEDIMVNADRARMEYVLQTILENAYTYTPPGRNVDVAVGVEGRTAYVSVTDNGIGIAQNDLPKIFTKFYRTQAAQRADTEGFGVSLYLAQTIMKKQRGSIQAYSAGEGKGTTFVVALRAVA